MSNTSRILPVTRIRGELRPAAPVETAVNRFLEKPFAPGSMRLYTAAQAVVEQGEYRRHAYDADIRETEKLLRARALAQRVFVLAGPLKLLTAPDGSGRLFFNVQQKDKRGLEMVGGALRSIEGFDEPDEGDVVYAEFARGALARDRRRRQEQVRAGYEGVMQDLDSPATHYRMTATGLTIVMKDMQYLVRDEPSSLPLAE
jgi:hypothetical protein